jgi:hypothetical protein
VHAYIGMNMAAFEAMYHSRKVANPIVDDIIRFSTDPVSPCSCPMTSESTQPLTQMATGNLPKDNGAAGA